MDNLALHTQITNVSPHNLTPLHDIHKTLSDLRWQILSLLFHKLENYFCQEGSISSQPLSKEHW